MKKNIFCMILLLAACADGPFYAPREGEAFLQLTGVQVSGPTAIRLLFSEPLSPLNTGAGLYTVVNASTGTAVPVQNATVGGQTVTLTLAQPSATVSYALVAGHVYDVTFDVQARDNNAVAAGTQRFLADFYPPVPASPEAFADTAGNVLVSWKTDNRIGNTGLTVWRKTLAGRTETISAVAELEPYRTAYWSVLAGVDQTWYALSARNDYGESKLTSWQEVETAEADTFRMLGACLKDTVWDMTPFGPGFEEVSAISTCERVEFRSDSLDAVVIWQMAPLGLQLTEIDSTGTGQSKIVEE